MAQTRSAFPNLPSTKLANIPNVHRKTYSSPFECSMHRTLEAALGKWGPEG